MTKINDLTGQKFGQLIVLGYSHSQNGRSIWDCLCECGGKSKVMTCNLTTKHTTSCGHMTRLHKFEDAQLSTLNSIYRRHYNNGNIPLDIFTYLIKMNCFYCGAPPSQYRNIHLKRKNRGRQTTDFAVNNGGVLYNGLDQINPKLGHNIENVVPCCIICNHLKSHSNIFDFATRLERLKENPEFITYDKILKPYSNDEINILFPLKDKYYSKYIDQRANTVIKRAKKYNCEMILTIFEIKNLIILPCSYCDITIPYNAKYFNGLDRLDNNIGYTIENSVPCCRFCNIAKNNMPLSKFLSYIHRVKSFLQSNNILQNLQDFGIKI